VINDILDISKLQSGKYTVDSKEVDLDEVLQLSLAALKPAAIARGILMESKLNAALPSVRGDAGKLRQVFSNLISNSIKFTPAGGGVTVAAQALEDGGVSVRIGDTGVGMTKEVVALALNEYASSFGAWGEVISPRNMQLPYWLLTFEELIEVLIGNPQERKAEIEILQELIPLAKCRTIYDSMAQILGRMFRVPVNGKPITILELTGLPTESVNVVVSVLCRMTFDFALWSEGQVPVTLVCEPTILSPCNTVFALRMSNDRDQEIVKSAIADTGAGLLEFLAALGQREAIAFGDGVTWPVRIKFDELPAHAMPRSSSAPFTEMWQKPVGDEGFLDSTVDRWRNASASAADAVQSASMFAESVNLPAKRFGAARPGRFARAGARARARTMLSVGRCRGTAGQIRQRRARHAREIAPAKGRGRRARAFCPAQFEPVTPPSRPALAHCAGALLMVRPVVVRSNR
jgi:Histidine kinase-, DNA gyrase B-, and HSP90-like ATPase